MQNWQDPGPDGIQKNFKSILKNQGGDIPQWMTEGRGVSMQKEIRKPEEFRHYCPIKYLFLVCKLSAGLTEVQVSEFLDNERLLPKEQKGC